MEQSNSPALTKSNPNERRVWGLFCKKDHYIIPLKSLNVSVQIINNIARVYFTQVYYNPSHDLVESEFYFPVASGVCFDSFEAKYNNTTIKGAVKLKDVAKKEYNEALSQGRMAAYSEVVEETGDIMKVLLSNIPPNTDVSITYSYIEKLDMVLNKFWCFRLFSTLTPRYNGNLQEMLNRDINILSSYPTIHPNSKDAYPWNIEVNVQSSSPLTLLKSPSHNILTSYGNENHTCLVTLDSVSQHKPNKDFVIMFSNNDQAKVDYMLTPFEEGYCAMVNVAADFDGQSDENVYAKVEKAKAKEDIEDDKITHGMNAVRGEYVFLIDRSGSMDGDRIKMANSALQLFLKSLPRDSYFNVISFGSSYEFMHKTSIKYEPKALEGAIKKVQGFRADMGGTEILQALQNVYSQPLQKGYPRFVFLLTDGGVSNTGAVLKTIKENANTSQCFTIGIGNGCSPELITKGAKYGQGKHEFVADNADIYEKVVGLLNASLSPNYSDFSIEAANFDAVVKSVSPNPASVPFVLNGQSVTFYLFLRKEAFENESKQLKLTVKMHDTKTQKPRTVEVVLDAANSIQNDMVSKLGISDMITRLEEEKKDAKDKTLLWYDKTECKQALTDLSLKYGILTSETAFICEISDNKDVTDGLAQKKILVPTVLSHDYLQSSDNEMAFGSSRGFGGSSPMKCYSMSSTASLCSAPMANISRRSAPMGVPMMAKKESASVKSTSVLGSIASGFNSLTNAFSTKKSKAKKCEERAMPETRVSASLQCEAESDDDCEEEQIQASLDSYKPQLRKSSEESKTVMKEKITAPGKDKKVAGKNNSYLPVIMQQTFEGSWNVNEPDVKKNVLNGKSAPSIPEEIKKAAGSKAEAVWITLLVLLWLEVVFINEKKGWELVHQKGCEWLKENGVEYEKVKDLGRVVIQA